MRTPHARKASRASCRACRLSSPPSGQPEPSVAHALASHGGTQEPARPRRLQVRQARGLSQRVASPIGRRRRPFSPKSRSSRLRQPPRSGYLSSCLRACSPRASDATHVVQHGRAQLRTPRPRCRPRARHLQRRRARAEAYLTCARLTRDARRTSSISNGRANEYPVLLK